MTSSSLRPGFRRVAVAIFAAALSACSVNESGNIPCNDDGNCPGKYPQCISTGGARRCVEAVTGTPQLASDAITVAPAAMTGGLHPGVSLSLPALTGDVNRARGLTLAIASGGSPEPVVKSGGAAVTLADLGTTITVDSPGTGATDDKTYTYTLTVSNAPSSSATATATGQLRVLPEPALSSAALGMSPSSIPSGIAPTLSVTLPSLTSPASSAATVAFTISGCGTGAVTKSGGGAVTAADLGTTISIDSPASSPGDNKICTYTLSVANAATTPAAATATALLTIAPFVISTQPANAVAAVGGTASFTVGVSGAAGVLTYQWKKDGVDMPGKTASTLTFASVVATDAAFYTVVVTSTVNSTSISATSNPASLNVAPVIGTQPVNATASVGGSATFTVAASVSQGVLSYQWQKGGVDIAGETGTSLTFNPVAANDTGLYAVVITSTFNGTTISSTSNTVSLNVAPVITVQPVSATAAVGGNVSFSVTATVSAGALSYQWKKDGVNMAGKTASTLTFNPVAASDAALYTVVVTSTFNATTASTTSAAASLNVAPVITAQPANLTAPEGGPAAFSVTATVSQGTLSYQWKKGGTNLADGGNVTGATTATLTLNPVSVADEAGYSVVVTSTFNATTISTTSGTATLTVNQTPVISAQPVASQTVPQGNTATFSVTASAPSPGATLTYQWKKGGTNLTNGGNVAGATSATLTLTNVTATDEATYTVVVTSHLNSTTSPVTSGNSVLTVNQTPNITTQPVATQTVPEGNTATISVVATAPSAGATLSYQWKKGGTDLTDGGNVGGATTATLTLTSVVAGDAATYTVVVTSNLNSTTKSVTSSGSVLVINRKPNITAQPAASQTVPQGNTATFTVTATAPSGGATLSYQWKKGGTNLTNGGNVAGATSATLTLTNVTATDEATYTVVVTSNLNSTTSSVTSADAVLIVNQTPNITTQPVASQTLVAGATATFNVVATAPSAGATLTYQWKKGGTNLTDGGNVAGATTATLTLTSVTGGDAATYTVVVTSNLNATTEPVTSSNSVLAVNVPPVIGTQPTALNATQGAAASFTVAATGNGTLSYQWRKNGSNLTNGGAIVGANAATLNFSNTNPAPGATVADVGLYSVVVTNTLNATTTSATSNSVPLTVDDALAAGVQRAGASATVLPNGKVLIAGGGRKTNQGSCTVGADGNTAEIFDPATGVSTLLGAPTPAANQLMSTSRCQHEAVLVGTSVYFFGGANTTNVDVFDTTTSTFLTSGLPTINAARLMATATLLGASSGGNSGKIVIAGGSNPGTGAVLNSIELFTPGTGSTTYTAQLGGGTAGTGRVGHTATLVGKWLFFVGGSFGGGSPGVSSSVDAIDTTLPPTGGGSATIVNSTPSSNASTRWAHSAIALSSGNAILLVGGSDGTNLLQTVQTYAINTTTGSASGAATANVTMAVKRAFAPVLQTVVNDRFVVFGGVDAAGTTDSGSPSVELIDATTPSAITLGSYHGVALSTDRGDSAAVVFDNGGTPTFLVAGGDPGGASSAGTYDVIVDQ